MTSMDWVWVVALAVEVLASGAWFVVMGVWVILARRDRRTPAGRLRVMPWPAAVVPPVAAALAAVARLWAVTRLGLPGWVPAVSVAVWATIAVGGAVMVVWTGRVAAEVARIRAETEAKRAVLEDEFARWGWLS